MATGPGQTLSLRQTQRMIMTPMLQQAINLLQLSRLELVQVLRKELEENPVIDEIAEDTAEGVAEGVDEAQELAEEPPPKVEPSAPAEAAAGTEGPADERVSDFDWESYLEHTSDYRREGPREEVERFSVEDTLTRPRSLMDHLLFQLHLSTSDQGLLERGTMIIGAIDERGYLTTPLEELAAGDGAPREAWEAALRLVQSFEPTGVGARDLRECLLLQFDGLSGDTALARAIVSEHLAALEQRNIPRIAETLKASPAEVQEALALIASLDPKPGRNFSTEDPRYITPDVYIHKVDDKLVVTLNDEGLPRLRISGYYRGILAQGRRNPREVREFVEGKMRSALWLIRSIEQRQRTLNKVAESLVRFQGEFLERGIASLKPLTLREVADDIGMHESTVSRVTTNKYVQTPQGLFELKYFFHRGVPAVGGDSVSSLRVKDLVRRYLTGENAEKPLSDQKIVEVLRVQHGIEIARRTVAKYRSQLKIPASSRRRRF